MVKCWNVQENSPEGQKMSFLLKFSSTEFFALILKELSLLTEP